MSSLTEQERIGLEEVFLSISSSKTLMQRISSWGQTFSLFLADTKRSFPLSHPKKRAQSLLKSLKQDKIKKIFVKKEKRRKI